MWIISPWKQFFCGCNKILITFKYHINNYNKFLFNTCRIGIKIYIYYRVRQNKICQISFKILTTLLWLCYSSLPTKHVSAIPNFCGANSNILQYRIINWVEIGWVFCWFYSFNEVWKIVNFGLKNVVGIKKNIVACKMSRWYTFGFI